MGQSIVYENTVKHYNVWGSISPTTFKAKLAHMPSEIRAKTAVVFIDILRCTTTCVAAAALGIKGVVLKRKPPGDSFHFIPPCLPKKFWNFGGEKNGLPIVGLNNNNEPTNALIANSPVELLGKELQESYLLFYSTNGAAAFELISEAGFNSIYALSMANIESTAASILRGGTEKVWVVSSGFYDFECLEDPIAAGVLINKLVELGFCKKNELDDGAELCRNASQPYLDNGSLIPLELKSKLKNGQVARLLLSQLGHLTDLDLCVNGMGIEELWDRMADTVLVCRDFENNLLTTETSLNHD